MRINVHAGHNPDGKTACGAVGLIKESTEARMIKDEVIRLLRLQNHTVYDCTVNNGKNQQDVLEKIVEMCNNNSVDLDVSIHLNAGANDTKGNGKTTGVEVYVYDENSKAKTYAENVCNEIFALGYRNRGVKYQKYYVIKNTNAPAMLIECCFVDDKDDVELYSYKSMSNAIVKAIIGEIKEDSITEEKLNTLYRVQVGAYSIKDNAEKMKKDLNTKGYDAFITQA